MELGIKDNLVKPGEKVEEFSKLEKQVLMNAFMKMAPEVLLDFQEVKIPLTSPLLPSRMGPREYCAQCGEKIMDGKGIAHSEKHYASRVLKATIMNACRSAQLASLQ